MPKENLRTLYECFNPKIMGNKIHCIKGHRLAKAGDGTTSTLRWIRGEPLAFMVCQGCPDFDFMGDPVLPEDRGYAVIKTVKGKVI